MKFDNFNAVDSGFANVSGTNTLASVNPTSNQLQIQSSSPVAFTMNGQQLISMLPPLDTNSQTFWNNYAMANTNAFNNLKIGFPYTIHYWSSPITDLYGKKWYAIIFAKTPLNIPNGCNTLYSDKRYRFTPTGEAINPLYRIYLLFKDFLRKDLCTQEYIIKSNYWTYFTGSPTFEPLIEQLYNPQYTSQSQLNSFLQTWSNNFSLNFPNFKLVLARA